MQLRILGGVNIMEENGMRMENYLRKKYFF